MKGFTVRNIFRVVVLIAVSFALMLAVRDAAGIHDGDAVSSLVPQFHDRLWGAIRIAMLFVAALVSWYGIEKRSVQTLGIGLLGVAFNNNWWFLSLRNPLLWPSVAINYIGLGFGLAALLLFLTTFEDPAAQRIGKATRAIAPALGGILALCGTLWWVSRLVLQPPRPIYNQLFWVGWDLFNVLLIGTAVTLYVTCGSSDRKRYGIIFVSLVIAAAGTAIHGAIRFTVGDTVAANNIDTIAQLALPLGLGYSVLYKNAFGITFYLSRAVLFGALSLVLAFLFSIAEDLTNSWMKSAVPVMELASSAAVSLAFRAIENKTDQIIDRMKKEKTACF